MNDEDCKPGDDINDVIGNRDTIVEFEITNNRPDCYSIIGLARESAAAFGIGLERTAMGRLKINDLRLIFDNDMRFLNQC